MQKWLRIIVVAILASISVPGHADHVIKITNGEWLPLFSEGLKDYGPASKIATDAFASEGVKVEYGFFPWKRSYVLSAEGKWDGTIGWPYGEGRENFHFYSKLPVSKGQWVLFHRKGTDLGDRSLTALKRYAFGVTLGDWALDGRDAITLALRRGTLDVQQARTGALMFEMLAHGRIDVFPQQLEVGAAQLRQLHADGKLSNEEFAQITYDAKPYRQMPLYLLLSKKVPGNKQMMEVFDRGMEKLRQAGRLR